MPRVRAPELPQDYPWLNCDRPLSLKSLRGRVVILDFWTYGCINCLHMLPTLKDLERTYTNELTIIGVHSAKFDREKDVENVRQAILRYDIEHPVIVDQDFQIWQQYTIKAWPTLVIIDPQGYVVSSLAGESDRASLSTLLDTILQEHRKKGTVNVDRLSTALEKQRQPLFTPLLFPGNVLADAASSTLFIADTGHHRIVRTSLSGDVQTIIGTGQAGLTDGTFPEVEFSSPQGMTFDPNQHMLYVADTGNHVIRQVDLHRQTVTTIAGTGQQSDRLTPHHGDALKTPLNSPWGLVKVGHHLFIAMAGSHQIWQLDLLTQIVGTYIGTGAEFRVDGGVAEAAFAQPSGLTTDEHRLYSADSETSTIRAIQLQEQPVAQTVCGNGELFGFGDVDGVGEAAKLQHCLGITYMAPNTLWVADTYNHKIKQVDLLSNRCQTIFGTGVAGFQDGSRETAQFYEPSGLSQVGNSLYVVDTNNHAIRAIDLKTSHVETLSFSGLCAPDVCFPTF
ncbi:MAG TPA: thioredoxin-like domain-containing protein [Crinalium sp.]